MSIAGFLASLLVLTNSSQWWLDDYQFAATELDGSGAVIAVIDTGIDANHPDLAGTVIGGADFSGIGDSTGTSPVGPSYFHGTMVASLIAGQGEDSNGVVGVAPGAKLLSISIGLGLADADTDTQLAEAIIWAADNGADIINLSLTRNSAKWPASWDEAFLYAFERDVVIVAATGNQEQGKYATAPAVIPGVIAVTAVDKFDSTDSGSGSEGIAVSVAAPGDEMLASYPGGGAEIFSGSSAAAPVVSGLLALMIQADPEASANDLIQRLIASADDAGEPGFDAEYGFGLINPLAAVESKAQASENPLGSLANWVKLYRPEVIEDAAELVPPPSPESAPESAIARPVAALESINPLLYLLLVPLALLPLLAMRKRLGRLDFRRRR